MNASIPAALLALVLAGGWLLGRRRSRPFLRSTDTTAVAALNRAQIERLQARTPSPALEAEAPSGETPVPSAAAAAAVVTLLAEARPPALPLQARERRRWLRLLQSWMAGSREQRLQALAMARQSSRPDVLPLLRLGLRDPDPEVMAAAAAAMVRFRGRSTAGRQGAIDSAARRRLPQPGRAAALLPRRVLRTR